MTVFVIEAWLTLGAMAGLLVVKCFALASAAMTRADAFTAADKLSKPAWLGILAAAVLLGAMEFVGFSLLIINLIFTVAAFVFLADVRPAVKRLTGRR